MYYTVCRRIDVKISINAVKIFEFCFKVVKLSSAQFEENFKITIFEKQVSLDSAPKTILGQDTTFVGCTYIDSLISITSNIYLEINAFKKLE